jgi:hypothetical protein
MLSGGKMQGVGVGLSALARRRLGLENDMVWSGVSMTVEKHVARLVAAVLAVTVVLVVGATGDVMAAPPNITIDHPLTGSSTANQTPPFSGTTDDILDPVTLYIYAGVGAGGSPVQTLTVMALLELTPLEGAWAAEPESALEPGQYTAVAEQTNVEPPAGQSAPVTFTVDTSPPSVSIASVPSPTNDSTPTLTGGAGTAAGDDPTVAVAIYEGGSTSGSPVRTVGGTVSGSTWTAGPIVSLPDGTYTAQVSQGDEAGNTGQSAAVTFTVDTTPPAVSLGSVSSPTKDSTPTLTGGAGTAAGDDPTVAVAIYEGGSASGSPVRTVAGTVSGSTWTAGPIVSLPDGTYTAQVSQGDEAGNTGKSVAVTFRVDTSPPVIAVTVPAAGAVLNSSNPTVSGLTVEASGDDPLVTLKLYAGSTVSGSPIQTDKVTPSGANWTTGAVSALADGTYTVLAEQSDEAGNTGKSAAVTFAIDTTLPAVTLTSPADKSSTSAEFESFSGAAGSAAGDLPQVTVKLFVGSTIANEALKEVTVPAVNGHWSAAFGGLSSGTYTAQAQQSDDLGRSGLSEPVTFTVNIPVPGPPPVTPPVVSAPSAETTPSPPVASFHWFPSAPYTGEAISLVSTSTDASSPITGFGAGAPTLTTSFSTPGAHVVLLQVTDANGLSSIVAETIPVTSPAPTLMQPFPVVRIAGSENASGVRVGLLTVQAPVGATVNVSCRGPGCRARSQDVVATSGRSKSKAGMVLIVFRRFEHPLRAGAALEIRVSKPGQIGKYTRFAVRHAKLPARVDTCLSPAGIKPIVCPSS